MPDSGGNNGLLSFNSVTSNKFNMVQVRIAQLGYAWDVIAKESHASRHRAFYPHQRAVSGFAITLELKGYGEFRPFMTFMGDYIKTFMGANRRSMFVACGARNFARWGIPVKGVYDGDHVGTAVIRPTIFFEGMMDPLDTQVLTGTSKGISDASLAGATGDQAKFFYPFSEGSRNANVRPETLYDDSGSPPTATQILENAGGSRGPTDAVSGAQDAIDRVLDEQRRRGGR